MTILFILIILLCVWVFILHVMLCKARAKLSRQQLRHSIERDKLRKDKRDYLILYKAVNNALFNLIFDISDLADNYGDIDIHAELKRLAVPCEEVPCSTCVNDKGCVTCTDGDQYTYVGKEQYSTTIKTD